MTLTQLECFLAVARERHFGRAADRLERTQPAISLQIQRVEGELGLTLFNRNGARISLTGAGELFLPHAEKIVAESKHALMQMETIRVGMRDRIRVGILHAVAPQFLPTVLVEFNRRFPQVELILHEWQLMQDLAGALLSAEIDVAFAVYAPKLSGIKFSLLYREGFCAGVAHSHPFASRNEIPPSCLRNERFIVHKTRHHYTREVTFSICKSADFVPQIAFESEELETIQRFVAANLGVTILPETLLRKTVCKDVCVLRLCSEVSYCDVMLCRKIGGYSSRALTHFVSIAKELGHSWSGAASKGEDTSNRDVRTLRPENLSISA